MRDPDPTDGRGKGISVTAKGRAVRDAAIEALEPTIGPLLTEKDVAELTAILPTLQRLRRVLDRARD